MENKLSNITPITLIELLEAREQRAYQQQQLIAQYKCPLISLTIPIPGAVKLNDDALFLFKTAKQCLLEYFKHYQIDCITHFERLLTTGAEGFFVVDQPEEKLKHACIRIEQTHALGRLWDIDVISVVSTTALSRTALGHSPRPCLLCENQAKLCARSQQHATEDLLARIRQMVTTYRLHERVV